MKTRLPSFGAGARRHGTIALRSCALALAGAVLLLPAVAAAATHTVVIEAMSFSPQVLEASAGDTVVWVNKDPFPHTATAEDRRFDSGDIAAGQSWTLQVSSEGQSAYVCSLHPTMKGTLIVKRK